MWSPKLFHSELWFNLWHLLFWSDAYWAGGGFRTLSDVRPHGHQCLSRSFCVTMSYAGRICHPLARVLERMLESTDVTKRFWHQRRKSKSRKQENKGHKGLTATHWNPWTGLVRIPRYARGLSGQGSEGPRVRESESPRVRGSKPGEKGSRGTATDSVVPTKGGNDFWALDRVAFCISFLFEERNAAHARPLLLQMRCEVKQTTCQLTSAGCAKAA